MKILHVETGRHFYGGAQQVVWLAQGLNGRGIENILVCTPDSDIFAVARAEAIEVAPLSCSGDLDFSFAWRLRRQLIKERPDIVHCHSRRGADFLGGQAAAMAGIPAVVSRRVDNADSALGALLRYRLFKKVIAISQHVQATLQDGGLGSDRLALIRSAVLADRFDHPVDSASIRRQFGIENDTAALATVGQLIPRKGHRYLLQALAGRAAPPCKLVIFGVGPLEEELRALVDSLGLREKVCFAGFRGDLDEFLAGFDVLVHPALQEGLGVAMLKAAAAAVPVVAFDAAGSREAVVNGETGLLVPVKNTAALSEAILRLARDPDRRAQLGAAGRQRMQQEFSVDRMVDAHIDLYQSVLNG